MTIELRWVACLVDFDSRVADMLEPRPAIFLQTTAQQAPNRGRRIYRQQMPLGLRLHDACENFADCLSIECRSAGKHFIEQTAKGPDIRSTIRRLPFCLFRRH